ncbi:MAG TPA: class F sortase [Streptosporangiaceae bacterium]|jgi:sortase (surface protein transpeptidase)
MDPARLELHHEPPCLPDVETPVRVRIPGLALRVRLPGRKLQHRLAAAVLAVGLGATATTAAGLATTRHDRYVLAAAAETAPRPAPAPHGSWVASPPPQTPARPVPPPVSLTIPAIGVHARLIRLRLTRSGALQAPHSTTVAGWYTGSPPPGATGSAVIGGHVDSHTGPGIFFRLHLLRRGDRIYVRQAGGRLAVFLVTSVQHYLKAHFPTSRVYGPVPTPQLRLITCGGTFDPSLGSYLSNVVVYAALTTPAADQPLHQAEAHPLLFQADRRA